MKTINAFWLSAAIMATATILTSGYAKADIKVLASIKPVHSLVAAVMEGIGKPGLIIKGAGSPHAYRLRPSQAAELEKATLVFWIGNELETFLGKAIDAIASNAESVALINTRDLVKLGFRKGGVFDENNLDDEDQAAQENGSFDPHIWLDPENAKVMVDEIAQALAKADPGNAIKYQANAKAVHDRLNILASEVQLLLNPVKNKGFIVFHDGYRYFERRFGISAAGSITVSPEVMPGAGRIGEIQTRVKQLAAACVFAEPQFEPKLISVVIEGTKAKSGFIDPLGAGLKDGPDLYFKLIRNMAIAIRDCLGEAGYTD